MYPNFEHLPYTWGFLVHPAELKHTPKYILSALIVIGPLDRTDFPQLQLYPHILLHARILLPADT